MGYGVGIELGSEGRGRRIYGEDGSPGEEYVKKTGCKRGMGREEQ